MTASMQPIILASSSLRRHELLRSMGVFFEVIVPDINEGASGDARETVIEMAQQKAWQVAQQYPERYVLGSDTLVAFEGAILGKPRDEKDACSMLAMLQGRWHEVHSGVCLYLPGEKMPDVRHCVTRVHFAALTDDEIRDYVLSGEPQGKAGAYSMQGNAGMFVTEIVGSFSNVIGLPTAIVRDMLIANRYPLFLAKNRS